jgi:lysophospholipase L1-like esterase
MLVPRKTSVTVLAFVAIAALPEYFVGLKAYKFMDWERVPHVLDFQSKRKTDNAAFSDPVKFYGDGTLPGGLVFSLRDNNHSLDGFYEALWKTETHTPEAITRIVHYGDSPTTADLITADLRATLQAQFGDAGHGYVLLAKPWAWYGHRGVELSGSGWSIAPANQNDVHDGLYGLGGVSFRGGAGAEARIALRDAGHDTIEVAYLRQPGGGTFYVNAEGGIAGEINTNDAATESGFVTFAIPAGARHFTVGVRSGTVRLFGMQLLKRGPGVRYDSLGVNGAYVSVLSKMFREDHWTEQLKHYKPNLIIINYGTNESVYATFVDTAYQKEIREVIRRIRKALPEVSILVMSPMDRGQRDVTGEIATVPALVRLVHMQQSVANETGCGFFNTFEAMGGEGTMGRWYESEPRLVSADFIHPMPSGAKLVSTFLYRGLMNGYNKYKLRRMQEKLTAAGPVAPAGKAAEPR